jgi:hypothetical protein
MHPSVLLLFILRFCGCWLGIVVKKYFITLLILHLPVKILFFWRCLAIMVSNSGKAGSLTNIRCSILVSINRERM